MFQLYLSFQTFIFTVSYMGNGNRGDQGSDEHRHPFRIQEDSVMAIEARAKRRAT